MNPYLNRLLDAGAPELALRLADHAVAALVGEATLTPKPGLVDLRGAGVHRDLDWPLMCASAAALRPAFGQMALAGILIADDDALLRRRIGALGRRAEAAVRIHAAAGVEHRGFRTAAAQAPHAGAAAIAARAGRLARIADPDAPARTGHKGEQACLDHGVGGARGQAQAGFPHIVAQALPMLHRSRERGDLEHHAQVNALLAVMASLDDTCVLARGGAQALAATRDGARRVLDAGGMADPAGRSAFAALEADMRARHVSPGGAADLLAGALLLDRIAAATTHSKETN